MFEWLQYDFMRVALGAVMLVYLGARLEWFPLYGLVSPGFEWMPFKEQLYDLKAIPALYLLDSEKRVMAKDCTDVTYIERLLMSAEQRAAR